MIPLKLADQFARDIAGLDNPIPPAPALETWVYPGSTAGASLTGAQVHYRGNLVRPAGNLASYSSNDSFEKIAEYYAEKLGFDDAKSMAASKSATYSEGTFDGDNELLLDSGDWTNEFTNANIADRVRVKNLLKRSAGYDILVELSQADGNTTTHIVVLYLPRVK